MHDDVIDQADQRRGEPTPNALFGNSASVMLGDYMFANAADFIAQTDKPIVVRKFAKTIMEMAQGELVQDSHVFEYSDDINRYLNQIRGKTAVLFATAAEGRARRRVSRRRQAATELTLDTHTAAAQPVYA